MKPQDLKISTQLRLCLGVILFLVLILGAQSWVHTNSLWQDVKELYEHPLQVRRAIGELRFNTLSMSRGMKDLLLADNDNERQTILQNIDIDEADAHRQFGILYDHYLGPQSDIDEAFEAFVRWKAVRAETIRLLREGKVSEAAQRTKHSGAGGAQMDKVLKEINDISIFALKKGDQLFLAATKHKDEQFLQLEITLGVIFLISGIYSFFLLKMIRTPLKELTTVTDQFRQGKTDVRSGYSSANEFGILSTAFNALAETIQAEIAFREHAAQLSSVMLRELESRTFGLQVLEPLMRLTGSHVGAIYLLNEQKTNYEHLESIGLGSSGRASFSATEREGEFGTALTTRQIHIITDIPTDTRFTYVAVSGEFTPREIITIPLLFGQEVAAMISLANLRCYDSVAVRLVADMQGYLASWMNSMLANRHIGILKDNLEQQNRRLQVQQEELRAANEELEEQTQRLQQSEVELKSQQEELQVFNEELEEKNEQLELQKAEIEKGRKVIEAKARELELASKYKSEFLANMSHELRTPLNSLLLLAQGLAQNKSGNLTEEQIEFARIIHGSGSDLLTLINEILDLSKIEAGRIDLQLETIMVSDLVESASNSFQHMAIDKGIALNIIVADDVPVEILSDRNRVEQIIRNLIANAIKFTDAGSVTVTFGRPAFGADLSKSGITDGNCLAIAVKDTGIGIRKELKDVIFEAFKQADGGTSRKYGGTGLGLSISRELSARLGGEIQLESEPNKGSIFTLYLPLITTKQNRVSLTTSNFPNRELALENCPSHIPDDRDSVESSDRVMLIIEDDPAFAHVLYGICHNKGFRCLAASTGEEGLKLATEYLPVAVILDLRLPGMDGWGVLSALKENIHTRHIPVHIISVETASTRALQQGAVGHITKPVSQESLEDAFNRLEQVAHGKPKRLLVVDDDAALRSETVKLVGNGDVTTDEAENGVQALEKLRTNKYDCMVLDLGLPDMDGRELLAQLEREGVEFPPVVVYTASELTMDEELSIRESAESIVIKDVRSQERLLDEVSLFLHRVVSRMSDKKRKVIQSLYDSDGILKYKKILVVDDDMRTTFAVSHILSESGMVPLKAENGERALRLLDENPDIDLVLMDLMMPIMDGYETIRLIRSQEKFRTLPIIALTAKAMPEDREKCLAVGANDYLPKPLDKDRLFSMMRVWLCR